MTAIQHSIVDHRVANHRASSRSIRRTVDAAIGVVVAVIVTALPAAWALMVLIDLAGGSVAYGAALPLGLFAGLLPLAVGAAMSRAQASDA